MPDTLLEALRQYIEKTYSLTGRVETLLANEDIFADDFVFISASEQPDELDYYDDINCTIFVIKPNANATNWMAAREILTDLAKLRKMYFEEDSDSQCWSIINSVQAAGINSSIDDKNRLIMSRVFSFRGRLLSAHPV
jgi:hypothetical protein